MPFFLGEPISDASQLATGGLHGDAAAGEAEAGVAFAHAGLSSAGGELFLDDDDDDESTFEPDADAVERGRERIQTEASETGESLQF